MAVGTFKDLPRFMNRRATQIAQGVSSVMRFVATEVHSDTVDGTPVDTGAARSNWIVQIDAPFVGTIGPHSPLKKGSINETVNAQISKDLAKSQIAGFDIRKNTTIKITNNLDYIVKVDAGGVRLREAKSGFVGRGVQSGVSKARVFSKKIFTP